MYHLFFWHLPVDHRLPYLLSKRYGAWRGYPLSYTACVAARKMDETGHFHGDLDLVDAQSNLELLKSARDRTDRYFKYASSRDYHGVADGETDDVQHTIYYVAYFRLLCERISERFGAGTFAQYPFIAGSCVPGTLLKIQGCLNLVMDEINGYSQIGKRDRGVMMLGRSATLASRSSFFREICLQCPDIQDASSNSVDVLMLAMEESDRRSQAPLVRRLVREGVSLKWCCVEESRMALSADEMKLEPDDLNDALLHPLSQDMSDGYRWRCLPLQMCWEAGLRHQIHDCLEHAGLSDEWSPLLLWRVAGKLAGNGLKRPLLRRAMRDMLCAYKPRLVVMSSAYGAMATAQAEVLEQNIPLVRLPHGVENVLNPLPNWQGSAVGRFGQVEVDLLRERSPARSGQFHAIGSYHLGQQAMRDREGYKDAWPAGVVRMLYPVSWGLLFYPDTQLDVESDLLAMGAATLAVDAELTVRCHPRQREWDYFDYVLMKEHHGERANWKLSDGSTSLVEAMQASHIMILRTWSGSALQAMYANRPLVAWMPRPGLEFADHVLSHLPCRATTGEELEALLRRLIQEPDYRAEVVKQQHELLEQFVENPYGDPYAGAEKLVLETLERVKRGIG